MVSLDDFYLTLHEREQLADQIHPLFKTRGVPGTHDVDLAKNVIERLKHRENNIALPRFLKSIDDRQEASEWPVMTKPADLVIFEGWCVGAKPILEAQLIEPFNALEESQDTQGVWRSYMNEQLKDSYQSLFNLVDYLVMFKAPSFKIVKDWRLEQEQKLRNKLSKKSFSSNYSGLMDNEAVSEFVSLFDRLTVHMLESLPAEADLLIHLDKNRQMKIHQPEAAVVYTDLDGTLLDHHTYSAGPALAMLDVLKRKNVPVVICTSKTFAEVQHLQSQLSIEAPFIVENGAAIYFPLSIFDESDLQSMTHVLTASVHEGYLVKTFSKSRDYWIALLEKAKHETQLNFTRFDELSIQKIAQLTGLDFEHAERASQREFGEPIIWQDSDEAKLKFSKYIESKQGGILQGGRFMHLSGAFDKGLALSWLQNFFHEFRGALKYSFEAEDIKSIALGDSGNDIAMLEQADVAIVIRSPAHEAPELEHDNVRLSKKYGPEGWSEQLANYFNIKL